MDSSDFYGQAKPNLRVTAYTPDSQLLFLFASKEK